MDERPEQRRPRGDDAPEPADANATRGATDEGEAPRSEFVPNDPLIRPASEGTGPTDPLLKPPADPDRDPYSLDGPQ